MAGSFTDSRGGAQRPTRWLTPPHIVESLGRFDLDPCGAPGWVLAERTFQVDDGEDGLVLDWFGRVWCNPPYGSEAAPFVERMVEHNRGVLFVFARTETKLFQDLIFPNASGLLFLSGRVRFFTDELVLASDRANAPSVLVSFGAEDAQLLRDCGLSGKFVSLNNG